MADEILGHITILWELTRFNMYKHWHLRQIAYSNTVLQKILVHVFWFDFPEDILLWFS